MIKTSYPKSVRRPLRNLLLSVVGTAALTLASTASAGAPDDVIAYFLGNGDLAAGRQELKDNKKNTSAIYQTRLYNATVEALTNSTDNSQTLKDLRLKTTPSAVAIYTLKLIPSFTPGLSSAATQAGFSANATSTWKLKDGPSALKDAQKTAENAITLGLKSYPKGTANSTWTGVEAYSVPGAGYKKDLPTAAAQISYAVTYGAVVGSGSNPITSTDVSALTLSLVKKASSSAARNPLTPASPVTGLVAQFSGTQATSFNDLTKAVILGATKGAKKYYTDIVQAAAYALAGTYVATGGTATLSTFDLTLLLDQVYGQLVDAGVKAGDATRAAVRNSIQLGLGAGITGYNTFGGGGVSTLDAQGNVVELFAYNNGKPLPVTDVLGN